jgi:hypothetical protein
LEKIHVFSETIFYSFPGSIDLDINIFFHASYQTSAAKLTKTAIFCVIMQPEVVIPNLIFVISYGFFGLVIKQQVVVISYRRFWTAYGFVLLVFKLRVVINSYRRFETTYGSVLLVIKQRVVVISYRRFWKTYGPETSVRNYRHSLRNNPEECPFCSSCQYMYCSTEHSILY